MRRSIDGLMAIIRDTYQMDPYAHALYLFCGKRKNTLKALYFDRDGFCLLYKRIDGEYYGAVTPQIRQAGNRLSGLTETACASLLA